MSEIKSTKDFWELKNYTKNPNYSEEIDKTIEKPSKFPFLCPVTGVEMNGISGKFVFGLNSKSLVSEKALKECNMGVFPNSLSNAGKSSSAGEDAENLHACYSANYEEKLMCPMVSKPFGRPILLYPSTKAEIDRAKAYVHVKKRKHSEVSGAEVSSKSPKVSKK